MSRAFWLDRWRRGIVQRCLVVVLALLTIGLLVVQHVVLSDARAQTEPPEVPPPPEASPEALDPVVYSQVRQLRQELALTNLDLAAMGLAQESAEALLQGLIDWHATNQTQLATQEQAQRQAASNLRQAYRTIHVGPRPRSEQVIQQMPTLEAQLTSTQQQRVSLLQPFIDSTNTRLTSDQQRAWSAARTNHAAPSDLRYVSGLEAEQVKTRQLTSLQQQQQQAARENQQTHLPGVLAAEREVLPVPLELQEVFVEDPVELQP